ncbi:hypothetical protein [Streptomyces sp. NPDC087300]|uniref:hypothetical protein n=1 Tax=Streptomyces sp. NPDC087300 TaxID=3365780 RepID=UPI0037F7B325
MPFVPSVEDEHGKSLLLDDEKVFLSTRVKHFEKTYAKLDFLDVEGQGWRRSDNGRLSSVHEKWTGGVSELPPSLGRRKMSDQGYYRSLSNCAR